MLLVIAVPLAWTLIRYYAAGGDTARLLAALPGAFAQTVLEVIGHAVSLLGLPMTFLIFGCLFLLRRVRRR